MLIYPFRHVFATKDRARRIDELQGRWIPWWRRLNESERSRAFDDSFFFLPYVRELLFADAAFWPTDQRQEAISHLGKDSTARLADLANQNGVLRLTLHDQERIPLHAVTLERGDDVIADLCIEWVDALLFPQAVGFLVIKVCITTPDVTAEHMRDTLRQLRQILPPIPGYEPATWRINTMPGAQPIAVRQLIDGWLTGLAAQPTHPHGRRHKQPAVRSFTSSEYGNVYGQSFRLYSYACLVETPNVAEQMPNDSPFASANDRTLWELATCSDTSNADYAPHADNIRMLLDAGHLKLWNNWRGLALHDNVVFLANQASDFTRESLPHNVESEYLHLYLLTLYQKIRLSLMSGESMREGKRSVIGEQVRQSRELVENLVHFRNLYWLTEVTFKPQGAAIYQRFRQGLGSAALFEAVSAEVSSLQGYYESVLQRGTNTLVNLLTFIGVPITVLTSIYNTNLFPAQSWQGFLLWLGVVVFGGWVLLRLFQFYLERRKVRS